MERGHQEFSRAVAGSPVSGPGTPGPGHDDALGKQGWQRLLSEFFGRVFRGRSDFTSGEKEPILTLDTRLGHLPPVNVPVPSPTSSPEGRPLALV